MGEPRHTPGPWSVEQPWNGFSAIRGASGELVFALAAGMRDEKRPDDVCEANARLMGAAPEMFEALEHLTELFVDLRPLGDDTDKEMAIINARAALSKATGEQ